MKNKIVVALSLFATLTSCDKNELMSEQAPGKQFTLFGVIEPQTRTILERATVKWCYNDSIGVFTNNTDNALFRNISEGNSETGEFVGTLPTDEHHGFAYYPYRANTSMSADSTLTITLPAEQTFASNTTFGAGANPAVAYGDINEPLIFRNLCGIVKVQLYGQMVVSSIEFIPNSGAVSGKGYVKLSPANEEPELVMAPASTTDGKVTLKNIHQAQSTQIKSYYLVVPPATYDSYTIAVTDASGRRKEQKVNKQLTVKRSIISSLEPFEVQGYTSYFYYSYAAQGSLNATTFGLDAANFEPGAMSQAGNRLYIANRKANMQSIIVYDIEARQVVDILRSWEYNGKTYTFPNENIDEVYVSEGKLYVANRSSKIEVFDAETLNYITRIGEGSWGETTYRLHHTFAIAQKDSLLFVREKNRLVTYLVSDIKEGSFQRVPAYQRTDHSFYDVNNAYNSYQMIDDKGALFITNFGGAATNKVLCIDPTLVEKGVQRSWIEPARNLALNFNPVGLAAHSDRFLILQGDGQINIYDRNKNEVVRKFNSIYGAKFTKPQKIYVRGDRMWVVDYGSKEIYNVLIVTNEIREYALMTRSGDNTLVMVKDETGRSLIVDVITHEIVEEL